MGHSNLMPSIAQVRAIRLRFAHLEVGTTAPCFDMDIQELLYLEAKGGEETQSVVVLWRHFGEHTHDATTLKNFVRVDSNKELSSRARRCTLRQANRFW